MGNPTRFWAIHPDDPAAKVEFFIFERTSWHRIWDEIIPQDAPNDLAYRLKSGPTYTVIGPFDPDTGREEIALRRPVITFTDPRLYALNTTSQSVFELDEFRLILSYMDDFLAAEKSPFDQCVFSELHHALKAFFAGDTRAHQAVLLDYFL